MDAQLPGSTRGQLAWGIGEVGELAEREGLYMRNEQEMMDLILDVAKADERIRSVLLVGSRANPAVPKDNYQDYDITYFVTDIVPFYNNPAWVEAYFGKPLIMQMPEAMRYPAGDGSFNYLMIFPDGNRIDLSFEFTSYIDDGELQLFCLIKTMAKGFCQSYLLTTTSTGISSHLRHSSFIPAVITLGGASIT